jgi:hypothetical protein
MAQTLRRRPLWGADDLLRWLVFILVGGICCGLAWYWGSGVSTLQGQQGPLELTVFGLVLISYGHVVWLLRARRSVGERQTQLLALWISHDDSEATLTVDDIVPAVVRAGEAEALVGGYDVLHFHRATCQMARGRSWEAMGQAEHERAGRVACPICRP